MTLLLRRLSNLIYAVASVALFLIGLMLIAYAFWDVVSAFATGPSVIKKMLDAIGLVVIALAVFDVAKYLFEEEVARDRELRSPREARETLTKFLVIVTIAVSLEALVFIFDAGTTDVRLLLYPASLLVAAVAAMVGLGFYQRLSMGTEKGSVAPPRDRAHVAGGGRRPDGDRPPSGGSGESP